MALGWMVGLSAPALRSVRWHNGMTATLESFFQLPDPKDNRRWGPNLELIGTGGILFLVGTSNHVGLILHRGPWAPPGHLEVIETPPRPIAPGPFATRGAQAPHHTGMVEELVAAIEEGREHRSSGRDGRSPDADDAFRLAAQRKGHWPRSQKSLCRSSRIA